MNKILKDCYKRILPRVFRSRIDIWRQDEFLKNIRIKILDHYKYPPTPTLKNDQLVEVLSYLKKNPLHMFPYEFINKYDSQQVQVHKDEKSDYKYVVYKEKRLYYPLGWSSDDIRYSHSFSCLEQDNDSPHSYESSSFNYNDEDIAVDAGAAEGNFSLSIVEKVKRLYIFECTEGWITPLKKTFQPWHEKVEIIPMKISNKSTAESTTLDDFFEEKNELPTILKIDVDGGEKDLLRGASKILDESKHLKISLCTYHQKNDFREFKTLLEKLGYNIFPSKGYMIFYLDEPLEEPYLRKALLFASKQIQ
jgi:hypothetical protein